MERPTSPFYARTFGIVTVAVLGYFLFRVLQPFFVPITWATLLAFIFQPLNRRLLARNQKPAAAAALVTALVAVTILLPLGFFLSLFVGQARDLAGRFQAEATERKLPALQLVLELAPVKAVVTQVGELTSLSEKELVGKVVDFAEGALQTLASASGTVVMGAFSAVTTFFLTMFLLFFFVRDGKDMWNTAVRLVPMREERKRELGTSLGAVTKAVVAGTFVTALVQGTLLGIGWAIAGLPSPVVFGSLGALASLIPLVGTALVWVPGVLTVFAQGNAGMSLFLLLWCAILVVGSDNVVRPLIISGSTNVSTLLVLVGVMGGVGTFGFTGIFVGPVFLVLVAALLRYADESRLGTRPVESAPPGAIALGVGPRPAPAPMPPPPPASAPGSATASGTSAPAASTGNGPGPSGT